ncbi:MAG: sigma 54-interacting transcriptional regulator [Leptolyngbyaceae cyanobacterium SL_1_1]|nr:sigma 54-interacting transcriptional regulator [Leptolyngbyaceae cyanobacterium RM1_1_2]NJO10031.1 sigma 54-interacting transcriptional regulator [Leptolyngbyaceae cyanobacterium SL_1_1]
MAAAERITWLQERTALNILNQEILAAIAPLLQTRTIAPEQRFVTLDDTPNGLWILRQGKVESDRDRPSAVSLLPGAVINLQALLLNQPAQKTFTTLSECEFFFVPVAEFWQVAQDYPAMTQLFTQQLAAEVEQLASQLSFEQERQTILRPYLVTKARRGIIGRSRYAKRLRSQIKAASERRDSAIIFGEPGLEKDNIAALIHYGSGDRREAVIQVECSKVQASGADLLGRAGGKPGLIEALGSGTLILNNLQELPPELLSAIAHLLQTNTYTPVSRAEADAAEAKSSQVRIIIISEQPLPQINLLVGQVIKVPPLRLRKADIQDYVGYYISLICRARGLDKPRLTTAALRRLQAYDFPNNLRELSSLVERSLSQMAGANNSITEEIIWPSQGRKKQFRLNLLNTYPRLRNFLRSPWWPDRVNYGFTLPFFAFIVAVLFIGPQNRQENFALNMFWAWWWPLVLLGFPFVGRLWCAVCPFMIYGEVTQKLSLWLVPRQLKQWPRQEAERWGGWFLFGLFALILLWEELWNLEDTAYLSACLLLLITAGAMIFSAIFERRFWCRYLCPIGGMNGLFAKLSVTELRAQQGTCSAECTTYQCYKGGPRKGEGQETNGCPLYSHPAQLEDNRDCVLCMTCLKACPHRSVEVNLRPPGIELWTTHVPRSYEVALLFLLLGAVFLHRLPLINQRLGLNLENFGIHAIASIATLSLPVLLPFAAYGLTRLVFKLTTSYSPKSFVSLAYGYLPLVLAANLAYYLSLGLGEGGQILSVGLATFGLSGEGVPVYVAHPAVIAFLQSAVLVFGALSSIVLTQKIVRQSLRLMWPQHLSAIALVALLWPLLITH